MSQKEPIHPVLDHVANPEIAECLGVTEKRAKEIKKSDPNRYISAAFSVFIQGYDIEIVIEALKLIDQISKNTKASIIKNQIKNMMGNKT